MTCAMENIWKENQCWKNVQLSKKQPRLTKSQEVIDDEVSMSSESELDVSETESLKTDEVNEICAKLPVSFILNLSNFN